MVQARVVWAAQGLGRLGLGMPGLVQQALVGSVPQGLVGSVPQGLVGLVGEQVLP
jgi:hypothetical protein